MNKNRDLIDRDELIDSLGISDMDIYAKECIIEAPTVDAVEVVHGKWDEYGNCSACDKNIYDDIDADMWSRYTPPYCPNCGTRMDL